MTHKKITKADLQKGDLVKTYSDSWIVDFKDNETILRSTSDPSKIMSLLNYTDDLIDVRRFRQKDNISLSSLEDILAIRKYDSKRDLKNGLKNGWDYTREDMAFLNNGFEVGN